MIELGGGRHHAQVLATAPDTLTLLLSGIDPTMPAEAPRSPVEAYLRTLDGGVTPIEFKSDPVAGDSADGTSRLTARLAAPAGAAGSITVPALVVEGQRYRLGGAIAGAHEPAAPMPAKVADSEERRLYLEPGGLYSEADIRANGHRTASETFVGFQSEHEMSPRPGDAICPITETKANAACTWVVNGKEYAFCCPPCVDEFVRMAKEQPSKVLAPEAYVK